MRQGSSSSSPLALIDPGWLYLLAGIALVGTTILIPAVRDLDDVRHHRDRALVLEEHRLERLQRYEAFVTALERREPALVISLAARQLNQIPAGRTMLFETGEWNALSASVFADLEPPPLDMPERKHPDSVLYQWTTSERARLWLLMAGGVCMLMGLMPRSTQIADE